MNKEDKLAGLRRVRNYFGEHDKILFEHWAYNFINEIMKDYKTESPKVDAEEVHIDVVKDLTEDLHYAKLDIEAKDEIIEELKQENERLRGLVDRFDVMEFLKMKRFLAEESGLGILSHTTDEMIEAIKANNNL